MPICMCLASILEIGEANSSYAAIDVTDEMGVKQSIDAAMNKWGQSLSCAVNSAFVAKPRT